MQIWPAIDIARGKCVRLQQGDFSRETVFGDPLTVAQRWRREGAEFLHLVDLDGARCGHPQQLELAARVARETGIPCQLGGGFRTPDSISRALASGITRVVLGTAAAIVDNDWVGSAIQSHPQQVAVGIDVHDGRIAIRGWTETCSLTPLELGRRFELLPVAALIVTDVGSDGMLLGPNWRFLQMMRDGVTTPLIASGGITTVQDVDRLARLGLAGAIIGRALYDGTLTLADALATVSHATADSTNAPGHAGC